MASKSVTKIVPPVYGARATEKERAFNFLLSAGGLEDAPSLPFVSQLRQNSCNAENTESLYKFVF